MSYQLPRTDFDSEGRNKRLGNITVRVSGFDHDANTVHGFDPRHGTPVAVRMATWEDFTNLYVNRDVFTTEEQRNAQATKHMKSQPTTRSIDRNVSGDTVVLQMQGVIQKQNGEMVARWMNSLTQRPLTDAYRPGMINVHIPKSNEETKGSFERRYATVLFHEDATAPSWQALDGMTTNRITGLEGNTLEGQIRSAVLVSVSDGQTTDAALLQTQFDKKERMFIDGADALLNQPMTRFSWKAQTALAAQVGKPIETLKWGKGDDSKLAILKKHAEILYGAVLSGLVSVALTPGCCCDVMPEQTKKIVERERQSAQTNGAVARMSGRDFYPADVSFRSNPGRDNYPPSTGIKDILPSVFLHPEKTDKHVATRLQDIGAWAIENIGGHDVLVMRRPEDEAHHSIDQDRGQEVEKPRASGFAPSIAP